MPDYLVMIFDNEADWASADPSTEEANERRHAEFVRAHRSAVRGTAKLAESETARSVRRDSGGEVSVTDGTFAETKEVLGGYYIIEAADLYAALEIAEHVPAPFGGVEVRPIIGRSGLGEISD
jgi:hypothetical protein